MICFLKTNVAFTTHILHFALTTFNDLNAIIRIIQFTLQINNGDRIDADNLLRFNRFTGSTLQPIIIFLKF